MHRLRYGFRHALKRLTADPHVLLAVAVVLAALLIELPTSADPHLVVLPSIVYLGVQIALAFRATSRRSQTDDTLRLHIALAAVFWMSLSTGEFALLPLTGLYVPIVVMASVHGTRPALVLGIVALTAYLFPVVTAATIQLGSSSAA